MAQQRPLVTEDPETVGAGRMLIEGGFDYGADYKYTASGLEGPLLRIPLIGVSVGLSSIAEVQIDGGFYNRLKISSRDPNAPLAGMVTATDDTTSDVEDIVIGTKIRLASEGMRRPAFGIRFATKLPDAAVKPELLFAGRVEDDALATPANFLTAYTATYRDPGRITDDFTFAPAATDAEYQRVKVITQNDGFWSTLGVIFGGLLLIGTGAAVIARMLVRRA